MKTFLESVVRCCRKWAVTAISAGLAQPVPAAFHAEIPGGGYVYSVMAASILHLALS